MTASPARRASTPRPETELLLRTARPGAEPVNDACVAALLRGPLDWEFLLGQAKTHATFPLLHWHLQQHHWQSVPAAVRDSLRDDFQRNAALNLARTGELIRLLGRFRERGIPALPFKGPTLAAYAYGSLSLRQFSDLDLLLRPDDLDASQDLLLSDGYEPQLDLPPARRAEYLRAVGQAPYFRQHDRSLVELHARLTPRRFHFPLGLEELWGRREVLALLGSEVPTLGAEDLLLVLSAHGAKHLFGCLSWISDLAALLLSHPGLDLALALDRARRLRAERMVLLGLRLAYDLLRQAAPEVVERRLCADRTAGDLAAGVWRALTAGAAPSGFSDAVFHLRVRESRGDGLAYSLSLALQPIVADWQLLALPPGASFLYYWLRPLRLAGKYGARLLGRLGRA
jgi:hypothetical protein